MTKVSCFTAQPVTVDAVMLPVANGLAIQFLYEIVLGGDIYKKPQACSGVLFYLSANKRNMSFLNTPNTPSMQNIIKKNLEKLHGSGYQVVNITFAPLSNEDANNIEKNIHAK